MLFPEPVSVVEKSSEDSWASSSATVASSTWGRSGLGWCYFFLALRHDVGFHVYILGFRQGQGVGWIGPGVLGVSLNQEVCIHGVSVRLLGKRARSRFTGIVSASVTHHSVVCRLQDQVRQISGLCGHRSRHVSVLLKGIRSDCANNLDQTAVAGHGVGAESEVISVEPSALLGPGPHN